MNENQNQYLSLKTAAELYGYTRDHLGFMIRQGKLKGIKLGSYYVTTSDWITDYLKKYADPGHPATAGKFSNKFLTQAFAAKENTISPDNTQKQKIKMPQVNVQNKPGDDFFSEMQKELSPSLQELSIAQEETSILSASLTQHYALSGNPYTILPIRKMEESERESILRKISNCDKLKNEQETA